MKPSLFRIPAFSAFVILALWIGGISFFRDDLTSHSNAIFNFIEFLGKIRAFPFGQLLQGLLGLSALFTLSIVLARPFIRKLCRDSLDGLEEMIVSLGFGMGCLSLSLLVLGTMFSFTPVFLRITAGILLLLSAGANWRIKWKPVFFPRLPTSAPLRAVVSTLIIGLILLNLAAALGPEIFFDSLIYHLSLPKLYLLHGKIFPTPYNIYSGIPFNTEMLYGLSLSIGGEVLAKLLPWGLSLAVLSLIFIWCRRFASEETGWIAALLFYSCPMISFQTWFTMVELNWCFLALLALFCLMVWSGGETTNRKWLALAGTFMGFCIGVKYNAVGILPIAFTTVFIFGRRNKLSFGAIIFDCFLMTAIAVALVSPWLIKNWLFYHNPLYPFLNDYFPHTPAGIDWQELVRDAKSRNLLVAFTTLHGIADTATSLWGREWTFFDTPGVALLWAVPLLLLVKNSEKFSIHAVLLGASWLAWMLTTRMPRFLVFAIPILSITLAAAIESLREIRLQYGIAVSIVLFGCLMNCGKIFNTWLQIGLEKVVIGMEEKASYLDNAHMLYPMPIFAAVQFINETLPPQSKVLFFEEARGYYCEREFIATPSFAINPLVRMAEESASPEELRLKLKSENISHILINQAMIQINGRTNTMLTKRADDLFISFLNKYATMIFERKVGVDPFDRRNIKWVQLYSLS